MNSWKSLSKYSQEDILKLVKLDDKLNLASLLNQELLLNPNQHEIDIKDLILKSKRDVLVQHLVNSPKNPVDVSMNGWIETAIKGSILPKGSIYQYPYCLEKNQLYFKIINVKRGNVSIQKGRLIQDIISTICLV